MISDRKEEGMTSEYEPKIARCLEQKSTTCTITRYKLWIVYL